MLKILILFFANGVKSFLSIFKYWIWNKNKNIKIQFDGSHNENRNYSMLDILFLSIQTSLLKCITESKLRTLFEGSKTVFDIFKACELTLKADRQLGQISNFLLAKWGVRCNISRGARPSRNGRGDAALGFVHFEFQLILALRIPSRSY